MSQILAAEIGSITQADLVETIRKHQVRPRMEAREWDYGYEGQTYPCWIVLEDRKTDTVVAYCEQGFGPSDPWGLMAFERFPNMGMDSGWFVCLEDAVRNAMFWSGDNPADYEIK